MLRQVDSAIYKGAAGLNAKARKSRGSRGEVAGNSRNGVRERGRGVCSTGFGFVGWFG